MNRRNTNGIGGRRAGPLGLTSAIVGSSCCILPLVAVFLGLGSGAFAATMGKYSAILIPMGLLGLALSYYLYFREVRKCRTVGCEVVKKGVTKVLRSCPFRCGP